MCLGLLLALGIGLRAYGIATFPFEQDELYTVIEATALFDSPLQPGIEARPLFYLLQHVVLEVLAPTPVGLRLLAFVFGVLGLWVTWVLARRVFGVRAALVALLLVVISPWHLHASGMARYWSLVYLLSASFFLFLFEAYRWDRTRDYLAALACLILGLLTHPTFLFPVVGAAFGVTLVTRERRLGWRWPSRNAWRFLWIPFGIALAVDYLVLHAAGRESSVRNFAGRGLLASLRLVPAMVDLLTPTVFGMGAIAALLLWVYGSKVEHRRWGAMALLGVGSSLLILLAASFVTDAYADYGISMLPLVFVSAGGLVHLGAERMRAGRNALVGVVAGVLMAAILPSTVSYLSDGMRFDYRPAFREIAATAPTTPVLAWPIVLQRHYAPGLNAHELRMRGEYLDSLLAREKDLWAVVSVQRYGIVNDASGAGAKWLARHCRLNSSSQRPRLGYRSYRVDLYRCRVRG